MSVWLLLDMRARFFVWWLGAGRFQVGENDGFQHKKMIVVSHWPSADGGGRGWSKMESKWITLFFAPYPHLSYPKAVYIIIIHQLAIIELMKPTKNHKSDTFSALSAQSLNIESVSLSFAMPATVGRTLFFFCSAVAAPLNIFPHVIHQNQVAPCTKIESCARYFVRSGVANCQNNSR